MKKLYVLLVLHYLATVVASEFPDKTVDSLVTQLAATSPNQKYIKKIEDLEDNNGIKGLIAFKQRSSDGTKCPFCLVQCTLHNLWDHIVANEECKTAALPGHLCCVVPANGQQEASHYCFDDDTVTAIKSALASHDFAAFVHWCPTDEDN